MIPATQIPLYPQEGLLHAWKVIYQVEWDSLLQIGHWGKSMEDEMQINAPSVHVDIFKTSLVRTIGVQKIETPAFRTR